MTRSKKVTIHDIGADAVSSKAANTTLANEILEGLRRKERTTPGNDRPQDQAYSYRKQIPTGWLHPSVIFSQLIFAPVVLYDEKGISSTSFLGLKADLC